MVTGSNLLPQFLHFWDNIKTPFCFVLYYVQNSVRRERVCVEEISTLLAAYTELICASSNMSYLLTDFSASHLPNKILHILLGKELNNCEIQCCDLLRHVTFIYKTQKLLLKHA
jgi:hypothetical protein